MAGRAYDRLPIEEFGRQLITSGDLDPVYIALSKLPWAKAQRYRWLIAYWCFYHCGFASYASEFTNKQFWDTLELAANNETTAPPGGRWPRGSERRHARGAQGWNMVSDLRWRYKDDTDGMVNFICSGSHIKSPMPFKDVADAAMEHTLFGPWIAFKIADMVDRCLGIPVDFEQAHIFMFKDPTKAAIMLWRLKRDFPATAEPKNLSAMLESVVNYLTDEFSDLKAPPLYDRPIGLQEVETVLCKWKSHVNGHYPLNNDIDEICEGLAGWGSAAGEFEAMMPEGTEG